MILFSEDNKQQVLLYPTTNTGKKDGLFSVYEFEKGFRDIPVELKDYRPMEKSNWIASTNEKGRSIITKSFDASSLASVKQAIFRCASSGSIQAYLNDEQLELQKKGNYFIADLVGILYNGKNNIRIESEKGNLQLIAEIEAFMTNGSRLVWNSDATWESNQKRKEPPEVLGKQGENGLGTFAWQKADGAEYYEIKLPEDIDFGNEEHRLVISFVGDRADAFLGEDLISDYLFDGTDWVIGINRFNDRLQDKTLVIRAKAFDTANPEIYFEKFVDKSGLDEARVNKVVLRPEYRFEISLK